MKKLSVIIPCYNAERFLRKCIESMKPQISDDIEVICVNDGSKDNTLQLLNELHEEMPQLMVVDQPNGGSAAARNNGFAHASGEFVWYVDADDILANDAFESIIGTLEKSGCDSIIFGLKWIDEDGNVIIPYKKEYRTTAIVSGTDAYLLENIPSFPWNRAFRRDFLEKNQLYFRTVRPDDEDFDLRTYACSKHTAFLNKCLYDYRIVKMSDSRNPNVFCKYLDGYLILLEDHTKLFVNHKNKKFGAKLSFNCIKNMYLKLAGYEFAGGADYNKVELFTKMKAMLDIILPLYKCGSIYYYMLRIAKLSPSIGYSVLKSLYKLKKGF